MTAMHDETQIQRYLDLEKEKRLLDGTIIHNDQRPDEQIATSGELDEDEYTIQNQELLRKRSDNKIEIETLLKRWRHGGHSAKFERRRTETSRRSGKFCSW